MMENMVFDENLHECLNKDNNNNRIKLNILSKKQKKIFIFILFFIIIIVELFFLKYFDFIRFQLTNFAKVSSCANDKNIFCLYLSDFLPLNRENILLSNQTIYIHIENTLSNNNSFKNISIDDNSKNILNSILYFKNSKKTLYLEVAQYEKLCNTVIILELVLIILKILINTILPILKKIKRKSLSKILKIVNYIIDYSYILIIGEYFKLFYDFFFYDKKSFLTSISFYIGFISTIFISYNKYDIKINLIGNLLFNFLSIYMNFDLRFDISIKIVDFVIKNMIIFSICNFSNKKENLIKNYVEVINNTKNHYQSMFNNFDDGYVKIDKNGNFSFNKRLIENVENLNNCKDNLVFRNALNYFHISKNQNKDEKFTKDFQRENFTFFHNKIPNLSFNISNTHKRLKTNNQNSFLNKKDDIFDIYLKISLFENIDNLNNYLPEEFKDVVECFLSDIFKFKNTMMNYLKDEQIQKDYDENLKQIDLLENEHNLDNKENTLNREINRSLQIVSSNLNNSNYLMEINTPSKGIEYKKTYDLNESDNILINNGNSIAKNKKIYDIFNIDNNMKNINDIIKFQREYEEVYKINEHKETNKQFKNQIDCSILDEINEKFNTFLSRISSILKNENFFSFFFLGEKFISSETDNDVEDEKIDKNEKELLTKGKNSLESDLDSRRRNSKLNIIVEHEICEENSQKNKKVDEKSKTIISLQRIYMRFNRIDDSIEILIRNFDDLEKNTKFSYHEKINSNPKTTKFDISQSKDNLFENFFFNLLKKLCHEIKNPILSIIEMTKISNQSTGKGNKNFINDLNMINNSNNNDIFCIIKDIKHMTKGINYCIYDFELLSDIIKNYEQPESLKKIIKNKILKNEGMSDLYKEIRKIQKIFEKNIDLHHKAVKIIVHAESIPNNLVYDSKYINICLYNLISNSVKFSSNGIIMIKINHDLSREKLSITISDQGGGIKKENFHNLGTLFFKEDNINNIYGLGIGIYIVKLIIDALDGDFNIISEAGKGTIAELEFNLIEDQLKASMRSKSHEKVYRICFNNLVDISPINNYFGQMNLNVLDDHILHDSKTIAYHLTNSQRFLSYIPSKFKTEEEKHESKINSERIINKSSSSFLFENYSEVDERKKSKSIDLSSIKKKSSIQNENFSKFKNTQEEIFEINNIFPYKDRKRTSSFTCKSKNLDMNNLKSKNFLENMSKKNENFGVDIKNIDNYLKNENKDFILNKMYEYKLHSLKMNNKRHSVCSNNSLNLNHSKKSDRENYQLNLEKSSSKSIADFLQKTNSIKLKNNKSQFNKKNDSTNKSTVSINNNTLIIEKNLRNKSHKQNDNGTVLSTKRFTNETRFKFNYKDLSSKNYNYFQNLDIEAENNKKSEKYDVNNESIIKFERDVLRILIVDDEELIRRSEANVLKKYFKRENIKFLIDHASDGAECILKLYLGKMKGLKYDLIITDETMKFMSGTFTCRIIRDLIKGNILENIKIMMVTSYTSDILEILNKSELIDDIFSKPLNINIFDNFFFKHLVQFKKNV